MNSFRGLLLPGLGPGMAAACARVFGERWKGLQRAWETGPPFACLCESGGGRSTAGRAPALLPVSLVTFSFLPPRPLASTVNDKLELQECLEHGRIAKVSPAPEPSAGQGARGGGRGQDGAEPPPGPCPARPLRLWVCLAWGCDFGDHVGHSHS